MGPTPLRGQKLTMIISHLPPSWDDPLSIHSQNEITIADLPKLKFELTEICEIVLCLFSPMFFLEPSQVCQIVFQCWTIKKIHTKRQNEWFF